MEKNINLSIIYKPLFLIFITLLLLLSKTFFPVSAMEVLKDFDIILDVIINTLFIYSIVWIIYELILPLYQLIDKEQSSLKKLIIKIIKVFIIIVGCITILQEWGFNVSGFLASLGLLGMAFALAAKDTVANLFGSFVIFTDKPFRVGDWIKTPDVEGIVEHIDIRSTQVRTFAQALVIVPNATLANSAILNWSEMGKRRIKMNIGLRYTTKASQLEKIVADIQEMLKNHKDIHQEDIYIYFTDFADSSLNIFCYFFTKTTDWGEFMKVQEDTNFKIMKIIEQNNANFAFPSRSLYIENNIEQDGQKKGLI